MKKIISLFKRDYKGDRLVYDEVVPGAEWVINGEGIATVKHDGAACMVKDGIMYKRYDRKLKKAIDKRRQKDKSFIVYPNDFKDRPDGWIACESGPNLHTGHWPGWIPVGDGPEDKWFRVAFDMAQPRDDTYELVGSKIQGNPYGLVDNHILFPHGITILMGAGDEPPRNFKGIKEYLETYLMEGIVWYRNHEQGTQSEMVKIKRRDFGLEWPPKGEE